MARAPGEGVAEGAGATAVKEAGGGADAGAGDGSIPPDSFVQATARAARATASERNGAPRQRTQRTRFGCVTSTLPA